MDQEHREVRGIRLLKDEVVWLVLHSALGLVEGTSDRGDFIVLTNQRVMGFWQEQGRSRRSLLPLERVDGVDLSTTVRSLKPLMQGGLLLLGAVVVVWLALAFNALGPLTWLIVATMVLLAAVTASTYFAAEQTAVITFRAGTSEVALALRTAQAQEGAQSLALGLFQARAGQESEITGAAPVVAPIPWPQDQEPGQRGDATTPESTARNVESAQAEGRIDV